MPGIYSEREILENYRINPEKGMRMLVESYSEKLYYHIRRILVLHDESDDALQETFIKAWRNLDSFRNESTLYTWLFRIGTNEALGRLKKMERRVTSGSRGSLEQIFGSSAEEDSLFDGDEIEKILQNAILSLPPKQRIVFQMKYYNESTYDEISAVLGTSTGALKASYHHAVKKIEEYISKYS